MAKTPKKVEKKTFKTTLPTDLLCDLQLIVAASGKPMSQFLEDELRKIVARDAKAVTQRLAKAVK